MKTIGVIGGMGWEGSAAYYRVMNRAVRSRLGGWHSARIVLDSLEFHAIAGAQSRSDFATIRESLVGSAQRLQRAGADLIVIACNTVHRFAPAVAAAVDIPLLHIAEAAGQALVAAGHRRVGLLGTGATMGGRFYPQVVSDRFGVELLSPAKALSAEVDRMVMTDLAARVDDGALPSRCRQLMDTAVAHLVAQGCTAVLLACTEFGLLYDAVDEPIIADRVPLFDTATVHALAAVSAALSPSPP